MREQAVTTRTKHGIGGMKQLLLGGALAALLALGATGGGAAAVGVAGDPSQWDACAGWFVHPRCWPGTRETRAPENPDG